MAHFSLELSPRFNETDGLGHINNTVIPIWFEAGREPIFKIFNPSLALSEWNLIVAGFTIAYKAPTFFGQDVTITTEVIRIGNSSFDVKQCCWQGDKLTAEATTAMVHYDYQTERSQPISEQIKSALLNNKARV
ncbi:acyl-CoA thioesterase [Shewanella marina]|uniref:acyl-CoA thioesterase n=1 Tax=Shewanella marina TaxID=487319 RepID=UPI0004720956|nr:thioesterase family protein [Shewanella marina]